MSEYFRRIAKADVKRGAIIRSDQAGSLNKRVVAVFADVVRAEGLESHVVRRISIGSLLRSYEVLERGE